MHDEVTRHVRVLHPHPGIVAFYDGRMPGQRFATQPNWVDDGAISLGIASYAVISGDEALVYDTHVSVAHARLVRAALESMGVRRFTVVLSHRDLDHIAGTEVFSDCPVIANARTAAHLTRDKAAIEDGSFHGLPAIAPLVLPTRLFGGRLQLNLGPRRVELIEVNIHTDDGTVLWLPDEGILLAGDTVEDCVTYVGEPRDFDLHLADLARLQELGAAHVLPNHGAAEVIGAGSYGPAILSDTCKYIRWLQGLETAPDRADAAMATAIAPALAAGTAHYFAPYERVHRQNILRVQAMLAGRT